MEPTSRTPYSDDIDVAALLRAINHRKGWILSLAAAVAAATYIALGFVTPLYTSQARVLIEREDNFYTRPADPQARSDQSTETDQEAVASQVQVLQSRDLALGVVKALRLEEDPEFNKQAGSALWWRKLTRIFSLGSQPTEEALQELVLDAFLERLTVYQLDDSRVIAVEFQSQNPETAAKAANKLAEFYLTWQQSAKLKQTKEASAWLSGQIKELTEKVETADTAAERFRSSSGLLEGSNNTTLDAQQLSELNSQLILAKAQRSEVEARAALIQKMLKDKGDVAAAADVLKSPLIQRLLEQRIRVQRELAELSVTLLPSHPRIRELNSELADLRRQIQDEARKVVSGLQNEAQIAGVREKSLRESLAELKQTAAKGNESQIKLRALEREAKANRELLESYLARYRDASARSDGASVPAYATIVSGAHVSSEPSFPKRVPISLLTFAAVALLGLAHTVGRELIMPQQSTPARRGPAGGRMAAPASETRYEAPGESVTAVSLPRDLARHLAGGRYRRIIATPLAADMDATSEAIGAARALSDTGQSVILVDATHDGDHIAIALDLPDAPGIHEMVAGEALFEETVRRDPDSEVQVITGALTPGRLHDRDAGPLAHIVHALEAAYDHVMIYAGQREASALAHMSGRGAPALLLLAGGPVEMEDALWHADHILGDTDILPRVFVLTPRSRRAAAAAPLAASHQTAAV